jgi:hypothetical protein
MISISKKILAILILIILILGGGAGFTFGYLHGKNAGRMEIMNYSKSDMEKAFGQFEELAEPQTHSFRR